MPYTLKFTLKQHTPLIHFQADDPNATLRATEVKPKLDRFLIKKLTPELCKKKGWLVGNGDHPALDYKMHINILERGQESKRENTVVIIPPLSREWVYDDFLSLRIFSFYENLITEIDKYLPEFFAFETFGTRQSKGWGSFSAGKTKEDASDPSKFISALKTSGRAVYQKEIRPGAAWDKLVKNDWQSLKTGVNFPQSQGRDAVYKKSLLFQYMTETVGIRWEKRHIKKEIKALIDSGELSNELYYKKAPIDLLSLNKSSAANNRTTWVTDWDDRKLDYEYRYVRALLGLAEHYEFLVGTGVEHERKQENLKYQVSVNSNDIERFKAPVTFRIFDNLVFVFANEIDKGLFDQKIEFDLTQRKKVGNEWVKANDQKYTIKHLRTPKEMEFSLDKFLDWALPGFLHYQKI